ncbi:MAG: hypothetical protein JW783_02110 [Bacteroidales bacterium]|nr:hypothetical protein [Bacteroidales bacterium]MBN2748264.1 hypothetical protein [Bacteroidales bacterium]
MKRLLALLGGLLCLHLITPTVKGQNPVTTVSMVKGQDYYANTQKAIDELGGIKQFVKKGQTVGILVNSDTDNSNIRHSVLWRYGNLHINSYYSSHSSSSSICLPSIMSPLRGLFYTSLLGLHMRWD